MSGARGAGRYDLRLMRRRGLGIPAVVVAVATAVGLLGACISGTSTEPRVQLTRDTAAATTVTTATTTTQVAATLTTTAPPPAAAAPVKSAVVAQLEAALSEPALAGRSIALAVSDAEGRPVLQFHAGAELLPASTEKLVTAAAALLTLGPDHRYVTRLNATAPPGPDGVLHGDLVLVGSGDPALGTPDYGGVVPERPRTPLEAFADQVAAAGVKRVTGNLYADPWIFPHQPLGPGWLPRYFDEEDTAYVSGLTVNGGRRLFHDGGRIQSVPATDPATEAAVSLRHLLIQRGVAVDGVAGAVRRPPAAPAALAAVASPPLLDLLRHMVRESDNHMADAVFRSLGKALVGDASWQGGTQAVLKALAPLHLDWSEAAVADGSGLSRNDRLSPEFLVALDLAVTRSSAGGVWQSLLSVAGVNGTLEKRLVGSLAQGRLLAKTGSLEDVRALAGQVHGPTGRYHFAVLANGLDRDGKNAIRDLQDRVALILARDLHGCFVAPLPGC